MNLRNGILVFNLMLFLFPAALFQREIELQYHEVKEKYNPDFNELWSAGFGKIIVRSFLNNKKEGGLLFENGQFRVAYPGFSRIVKKNNKRKFSLWGWLITRNYSWLDNSDLYDTEYIDHKRKKIKKLDIFDPEIRNKISKVFRDLTKLGVEGILIQDDLSIKSNEGFSLKGMKTFSDISGVPAREKLMMDSGSPYNLKWIKIKKKVIAALRNKIIKECRAINPDIKIGINVFYEASLFARKSNEWHSQDLKEIVDSDVDYIYLMMYHRQMKRELKYGIHRIKKLFKKGIENAVMLAGDRLVVKMETYDWNKRELIPVGEMEEFIKLIPENVKRICFTPAKNGDLKYFKRILKAAKN